LLLLRVGNSELARRFQMNLHITFLERTRVDGLLAQLRDANPGSWRCGSSIAWSAKLATTIGSMQLPLRSRISTKFRHPRTVPLPRKVVETTLGRDCPAFSFAESAQTLVSSNPSPWRRENDCRRDKGERDIPVVLFIPTFFRHRARETDCLDLHALACRPI
jgi:hypothetical protein